MPQGSELLIKAKRQRNIHDLKSNEEGVPEFLEQVCQFLQTHETTHSNECTHGVFENYVDWWIGQGSTYKLAISEDNTTDQFFKMITQCYDLGIPLTLTEKRTSELSFVQEIDIYGRNDENIDPMELMNVEGLFLQLIGSTMREVYPSTDQGFSDIVVFDATGMHAKKCVQKTSMRFVWPTIIVNKERARRIRDYIVYKFNRSQNQELVDLKDRILSFNRDNTWANVFHDCIYTTSAGLRMPFCDRVSPAPLKKPEGRPFKPLGVWRMKYEEEGAGVSFKYEVGPDELEGHDWLRAGSIRKANGTDLTDWEEPRIIAERIRGSVQPTAPSGAYNAGFEERRGAGGAGGGFHGGDAAQAGGAGPTIGRDPGRVQIRTRGGSNNDYVARGPRAQVAQMRQQQQQVQELKTVEREFAGDVEEFKQHLVQQIGSDDITFEMEGQTMVCRLKAATNDAHISYNPLRKRVSVHGDSQQIRSTIQIISRFSTSLGETRSTVSGRTAATTMTRRAASEAGSQAPSRAYAPSTQAAAGAAPQAAAAAAASVSSSDTTTGAAKGARRVKQDFTAQSDREMSLLLGDLVIVTHGEEQLTDPNVDGWIYGENQRTKQKGWFPRSYVEAART